MIKKRVAFNIIIVLIFIISIVLAVFPFRVSYMRVFESIIDLFNSLKIYGQTIFGLEIDGASTVKNFSSVLWFNLLPSDMDLFGDKMKAFRFLFFNGSNFSIAITNLGEFILNLLMVLIIAIPILIICILAVKKIYRSQNNNYNQDTVALRIFKKVSNTIFEPIKSFVVDFYNYFRGIKWVKVTLLILWILNLNLATILIEALAYYFYFSVSFDLASIYIQICKLVIDLQIVVKSIPVWLWLIIGYMIFDKIRRKRAIEKLRHMERKNCGFINELPIVSITCGSMGKKKTTMITDMALSQEVMFRRKILELLQINDMKFPYFPWIELELEIKQCMEFGSIYNLSTVKRLIAIKRKRYQKHRNAVLQLYGYDIEKYGSTYNNGLYESDIFEVLEIYAQLYFMYIIESSLIVSNYSIRTDNEMYDVGNFPVWIMDFFIEGQDVANRHAHILDFDTLRLGKKVIENNPNIGSFEFGVVVISEIGKERGNNLELQEIKKKTEEANQKNDMFNAWLKMCRHSSTVDNFPFIKVFTDEQRPESWGADARDLSDIIRIVKTSEQNLALSFYTIEEMLTEWIFNFFIGLYYDFRYNRGDNTLLIYLLKKITASLFRRNVRIYNKYGYSVLKVERERGTMNGETEIKKYYIMNGKIYKKRFSTDCFSDYFNELAKKSEIGLNDYREYLTEKASVEELKMQNSYFINALYKDANDG